jgi:hypothetical protein
VRVAAAPVADPAAVAVAAAMVVTRPIPPGSARHIADLIARPAAHQACTDSGGGVSVCAYRPYAGLARHVARDLQTATSFLPAGAVDGTRFLQAFDTDLSEAPPEVTDALSRRDVGLPNGALRLRFHSHPETIQAARMRLVASALGLPTEAQAGDRPSVVAGQARGVVVLWAAGLGLNAKAVRSLTNGTIPPDRPADATDRGMAWPAPCHGEAAVLQWAPQDLAAARMLLSRPRAEVEHVVRAGWDRWRQAATTTDELLAAAGLSPVGPPESVEARPLTCG